MVTTMIISAKSKGFDCPKRLASHTAIMAAVRLNICAQVKVAEINSGLMLAAAPARSINAQ